MGLGRGRRPDPDCRADPRAGPAAAEARLLTNVPWSLARQIEQLRLRLEELEADKAEEQQGCGRRPAASDPGRRPAKANALAGPPAAPCDRARTGARRGLHLSCLRRRQHYLRCCRAANRSATVALAAVPVAAAIAAAMFGSSSALFAPLNALAFMSRAAARSRVACAARVIASRATLMPLPLPLLRPATARAVSARDAARCSSSVAWSMSFFARVSLAFAPVSALAFA